VSPIRKAFDAEEVVTTTGAVEILRERCKGCGFCVEYCPRDVLEMSTDFNRKGYHPPYSRHPELCVACGFCEMICPEFAIYIVVTSVPPEPAAAKAH